MSERGVTRVARKNKLGPQAAPAELEQMRTEFEEMGLNTREARVLAALVYCGSGSAGDLAQIANMPQPNVYTVLDGLVLKRLVEQVPGKFATWAVPGHDEILERLCAIQRERLHHVEERAKTAKQILTRMMPNGPGVALPNVHLVRDAAHFKETYEQLLKKAKDEVLTVSRPPYSWTAGTPNPIIIETLHRIRSGRALFQAPASEAQAKGLWIETDAYVEAGLQARLAGRLTVKLVVIDRCIVLLAMTGAVMADDIYPTTMLIEDEGYAEFSAAAFDHWWSTAADYVRGGP
jgi:sugar-specific transcriptional regulator TrmB